MHEGIGRVNAEHVLEVGDGNEQWSVGITFTQHCVNLEYGPRGIARVQADAVMDDALKDRQGAYPHATMLA